MKLLLTIISFSLLLSQQIQVENKAITDTLDQNNKFNLSLGILDSRTGLSLIGLSYDIYQDRKNEVFVGAGTAIVAFTGSIGWRHYFSDTYNNNINVLTKKESNNFKYSFSSSPFVVVSFQAVAHFGFAGFAPIVSPGYEIRLSKYFSTQLGCNLMMLLTHSEPEFGLFPFLNMGVNF
ncbi:MAG: hypothetical protein CMF96_04970 [Candidatus Marinimicrobia bacterium]|nr:hypothetical protein [Candidatus Neomarinimicrobiota bacterium]|tara:strand:- start:220 stop:753 length:534 start_codon:yes stop_codon:yes gene_type:complete